MRIPLGSVVILVSLACGPGWAGVIDTVETRQSKR